MLLHVFLEMLGSEVDDDPDRGRNCCVQLIQRQERTGSTLDRLIRQGVPLREERYKWTEGDVKRLTEVAIQAGFRIINAKFIFLYKILMFS